MNIRRIIRAEKERDQLKKKLYDLRKAIWSTPYRSLVYPGGKWAEIDRLMGDWSPEKDIGENNSGDNTAEKISIPKPSNVPHVSAAGKIHEKPHPDSIHKLSTKIFHNQRSSMHWPEED